MLARRRRGRGSRRGKILAMTALMLPVMFGGALVSSDTVVLVNAQAQLRTAADAAALAGAMALADESRVRGATNLAALMTTARARAIAVASKNHVLGAAPQIADNPTNGAAGEIVIGHLAPTDHTSTSPATAASQATFNAVKVQVARDADHGGQVPTFFGKGLSIAGSNVSLSGTAIVQNHAVKGVRSADGQNVRLLPIALDKATYDAMMNRTTADQWTYCPPPNEAVSAGADGVPESQLYPTGTGSPGNFGTIKVGVSNNSTSTLDAQIRHGITPAQVATFPGGKIELNSALNPPSITFGGNPGLSAGIKDALVSRIGKTAIVPIYDQVSGNGNNTTYRVVAFAPARIMAVNFQGNPKYVLIQPALMKDTNAIAGAAQTAWTKGGLVRLYLAR